MEENVILCCKVKYLAPYDTAILCLGLFPRAVTYTPISGDLYKNVSSKDVHKSKTLKI